MRFTIERSRTVHRGRVFDIAVKDVRFSDGRRSRLDVVEHPGAAAVVPFLPDGRIVLIRQLRVPAGGMLYEIPAGVLEPGERPAETARRELAEETGYRPGRLRRIMHFYTVPGMSNEYLHVYLARDLRPARAEQDEDERIRVRPVARKEALRMVWGGRIRDAKSIIGILAAERALHRG